jgi:NADH-quinone oxidoreductase subunit N
LGAGGLAALLFYLGVYAAATVGVFAVLNHVGSVERPIDGVDELAGLGRTQPLAAVAMSIFLFSLAGVPPLFGFWPKLLVFRAAIDANLVALATAAIVGTVIGAYYYLKIVKIMYLDEAAPAYGRVHQPVQGALIFLSALAVSPLGYLLIEPLQSLSDRAAVSIF